MNSRELRVVGRLAFCVFLSQGDPLADTWPLWVRVISEGTNLIGAFFAFIFAMQWCFMREDGK